MLNVEKFSYDPTSGLLSDKNGRPLPFKKMGGNKKGGEYLAIIQDGKIYYAHRLAFFLMTGQWPKKHVDHINGIKTDNRWCNLREANMAQNKANEGLRSTNSSGWKGVSWHKAAKKWRAYVGSHGDHLGLYDCPAAAHFAYIVEANRRYGEYIRGQ